MSFIFACLILKLRLAWDLISERAHRINTKEINYAKLYKIRQNIHKIEFTIPYSVVIVACVGADAVEQLTESQWNSWDTKKKKKIWPGFFVNKLKIWRGSRVMNVWFRSTTLVYQETGIHFFGLGSDLYDDNIGTNGISRMNEQINFCAIGQNA